MLSHALISSRQVPQNAPSKTLRIKVNVSFLDVGRLDDLTQQKQAERKPSETQLFEGKRHVCVEREKSELSLKNRQNTQQSLHSLSLNKAAVAVNSAQTRTKKHTSHISWVFQKQFTYQYG